MITCGRGGAWGTCTRPEEHGGHCDNGGLIAEDASAPDLVNHPPHFTAHPSGVECIAITEHMNFCLGNAVKYLWRAGIKNNDSLNDLRKARWYVDREIARLEARATA